MLVVIRTSLGYDSNSGEMLKKDFPERYKVMEFLFVHNSGIHAVLQQLTGSEKGQLTSCNIYELSVVEDKPDEVDVNRLEYLNEVMSVIKNK